MLDVLMVNQKNTQSGPALLVGACQFCSGPMRAIAGGWECADEPSHRLVWAQMLPIADPGQKDRAHRATKGRKQKPLLAFPYYGGKAALAWFICSLMPAHKHYLEPFGGSAGVLINKQPSKIETYNDIDRDVWTFFRMLRENPEELLEALRLTPWSREEFHFARYAPDEGISDLERARRFYTRVRQGYNAIPRRSRNGWSSSIHSASPSPPRTWQAHLADLLLVSQRLAFVQLENRNGIEVLRRFDQPDLLAYIDPSYVLSTRSKHSSHRHRLAYVHEMTDAEHTELGELLQGLKGKAIVSGYRSKLYDQLFKGWLRIDIPVKASSSGTKADRVESLWLNYDPPVQALLKLTPKSRQLTIDLEAHA